nr:TPA_asm: hypothetical protein [Sphaeridio phenuili virus]
MDWSGPTEEQEEEEDQYMSTDEGQHVKSEDDELAAAASAIKLNEHPKTRSRSKKEKFSDVPTIDPPTQEKQKRGRK